MERDNPNWAKLYGELNNSNPQPVVENHPGQDYFADSPITLESVNLSPEAQEQESERIYVLQPVQLTSSEQAQIENFVAEENKDNSIALVFPVGYENQLESDQDSSFQDALGRIQEYTSFIESQGGESNLHIIRTQRAEGAIDYTLAINITTGFESVDGSQFNEGTLISVDRDGNAHYLVPEENVGNGKAEIIEITPDYHEKLQELFEGDLSKVPDIGSLVMVQRDDEGRLAKIIAGEGFYEFISEETNTEGEIVAIGPNTPAASTSVPIAIAVPEAPGSRDTENSGGGAPVYLPAERVPTPEIIEMSPVFEVAVNRELPENTFVVENNFATPVPIDNASFSINEKGELVAYDINGNEALVYTEYGWAIPQFETNLARIVLDYDYTTTEGKTDDGRDILNTFAISPTDFSAQTPSVEDFRWLQLNQLDATSRQNYLDQRGGAINSPLTRTPGDNKEAIDNTLFTFYTMVVNQTSEPTEAQLIAVRDKYENTTEQMAVLINGSEWDLRQGATIIYAPTPEGEGYYGKRRVSTIPESPFVVDSNGQAIMKITLGQPSGWIMSSSILSTMSATLRDAGIRGQSGGAGVLDGYPALTQSLFTLTEDNQVINYPITGHTGEQNTGGQLATSTF